MKNFRVAEAAVSTITKNMKLSMSRKSIHRWYVWIGELRSAPEEPDTWVNIVQVQRMLGLKQKRKVTTTQQYELLILKFLTLECARGDHRRYDDDTANTNI